MGTEDTDITQKQINDTKEERDAEKEEEHPKEKIAKLLTSSRKESLVERFEGFFYW